jgi:hypothetical protein
MIREEFDMLERQCSEMGRLCDNLKWLNGNKEAGLTEQEKTAVRGAVVALKDAVGKTRLALDLLEKSC